MTKKLTLVPEELHSKTTGELFRVSHAHAAARRVAGLVKKELTKMDQLQREGTCFEAGYRVALVELYEELLHRGAPAPVVEEP